MALERPGALGRRVEDALELVLDGRLHLRAELEPTGGEQLDAVVCEGVVGGRDHHGGESGSADSQARAGVGRTPTSTTSAPSLASPADRAACSMGPDRRVSRPIRKVVAVMVRATARPRARTRSVVSSTLAIPRTPSVPNRVLATGLPLGVLGSLACLLQAVLLRLLLPRVTGEEAGFLELGPQLGIELAEGPGDPRRKAPAWPDTPPPSMVTSMAHDSVVSVSRRGSVTIIRWVAEVK